jgi:hypothetical protein
MKSAQNPQYVSTKVLEWDTSDDGFTAIELRAWLFMEAVDHYDLTEYYADGSGNKRRRFYECEEQARRAYKRWGKKGK